MIDNMPALTRRSALSLALAAALPAARSRADVTTVRIGVQKYGTLVILRDRGQLDDELGKRGYRTQWTEFPAGPQLLEALNVGELDFGTTGEAPPIFAQAAGAPLVYVGVEPPSPSGEAILVPGDSPIRSVGDLRGRRVALNKGSNVHFLLVQALAAAKLTPADIAPVYLAPADARAAFEQGSVDAWVIWDPFLASAQQATDARVLADATGLAPNRQYFLASREFADRNGDLLRTLMAQITTVDGWAQTHQQEVAELLAPRLGISAGVLTTALARMGYGAGPMTPEAVADQQRIADTFYDLRLIPTRVDVRSALWNAKA